MRQWLQNHDRNAFHEEIHQGMQDEETRLSQTRQKKIRKLKEEYQECNDEFSFIAGYTSGGVPYGTAWEEEGIDPDFPY